MVPGARFPFSTLVGLSWALLALALLSGCVTQTIHPLYSAETLIFDDRLLGTFSDDEFEWTFERDGERSYRLIHVADDGELDMEVRLVRLGETTFLDLYVDEPPTDLTEMFGIMVMPVHVVFRVDALGDGLKLSGVDGDWIVDYLQAHPGVPHTIIDGRVVLTAETAELQAFYEMLSATPESWVEDVDMRRLSP